MEFIVAIIRMYEIIIVLSAVVSWIPMRQDNPMISMLRSLTEPVYAPIRRVLSPSVTGGIDLSPLIVLLGLQFLRSLLRP